MSLADYLDEAFSVDDGLFAVDATWTPAVGDEATVQVMFSNPYYSTQTGNVSTAGRSPSCLVRDAQIRELARADVLTIEGDRYSVLDILPSGLAFTRVTLQGPLPEPGGFALEDGSGAILLETGDKLLKE